jgi:hypothetical protein
MNDAFFQQLTSAVDAPSTRERRAADAAGVIASAGYRWTAIYEADDDRVSVLGEAGTGSQPPGGETVAGALAAGAFVTIGSIAVVPILGAESGIAIGALVVERGDSTAYTGEERGALERCAAIVIALFE